MMKFTYKIYEDYIGLILHIVSKHYATTTCSHMDMVNAGILGLCIAVRKYNPKKTGSCPLKNYIYMYANSEIIKAVYKSNKPRREISGHQEFIDNTLENKEDPYYNPEEHLMQKENEVDKESKLKNVYRILNNHNLVKPQDRLVYLDKIAHGMPNTKISKKYNLEYCHVSKIVDKVNKTLRRLS